MDKFLVSRFPDHSRSYFQRLIEKNKIAVNGRPVEKDTPLKAGDLVSGEFEAVSEISVAPDDSVKFKVVYDAKEFAVVEKPAGLVAHPSATHKFGTLVNGLLARWPEIAGVGESVLRPGIVHRLDKETSGLMVVAKTQSMYFWLKKQFQDRKVNKKYTALVFGKLRQEEGEISIPIARHKMKQITAPHDNKRFSGKYKSRNASTGFKVLGFYDNFTLVEASPKTGRMHQIRVHFKHIGHPLVGDKTYAPKRALSSLPAERHFLHAGYLSFVLPSGEKAEFSSDLPADLKKILAGLEKS